MNVGVQRDQIIINAAGLLRSLGVGLMGVVLGIYLSRVGFSALRIVAVVAIGLAGSAVATTIVGFAADRIGRKRFLVFLSILTALGGLALYASHNLALLLAMAFIAMLNGTGTERSAIFTLEQAVIPGLGPDTRRTLNLALYNVLIDGGTSFGALVLLFPHFCNVNSVSLCSTATDYCSWDTQRYMWRLPFCIQGCLRQSRSTVRLYLNTLG